VNVNNENSVAPIAELRFFAEHAVSPIRYHHGVPVDSCTAITVPVLEIIKNTAARGLDPSIREKAAAESAEANTVIAMRTT